MNKSASTFQKWMTAITFAEAGEWETAKRMAPNEPANMETGWISKTFMAAAYAEANQADTALEMIPAILCNREISPVENLFMAAVFAEAGQHDFAANLVHGVNAASASANDYLAALGLSRVRMTYGVFAVESAR
ncbi:hypothetical protein ACUUL3_14955 [Thiovibrio sp. JS02]